MSQPRLEPKDFDPIEEYKKFGGDTEFLSFLLSRVPPEIPTKRGVRINRLVPQAISLLKRLDRILTRLNSSSSYNHYHEEEQQQIRQFHSFLSAQKDVDRAFGKRPSLTDGKPRKYLQTYFLLAALVPYTEFIAGDVQWAWVCRLIGEKTKHENFNNASDFWKRRIRPNVKQPRHRPYDLDLALMSGPLAYLIFKRGPHAEPIGKPTPTKMRLKDWDWETPLLEEEARYLRIAGKYLPEQGEIFAEFHYSARKLLIGRHSWFCPGGAADSPPRRAIRPHHYFEREDLETLTPRNKSNQAAPQGNHARKKGRGN